LERAPPSRDCIAHAAHMSIHHVVGNGPRSTVDHQDRIIRQSNPHEK
jgi:hypothetical protein